MEEKDVIDVEVVSEEETVIDTVKEEETPLYSDEVIDEKLVELKKSLELNSYETNNEIEFLAQEIAINSKEYLDTDTYLWVMYVYALKYHGQDNKNAERFCFIRMNDVLSRKEDKLPKALTPVAITVTDAMRKEIEANTAFIKDVNKSIRNQYLVMQFVMVLIFAAIFMFLMRFDAITTFLMCISVFVFSFLVNYRKLTSKFLINQTETSKSHCKDEEILAFDLPVANS